MKICMIGTGYVGLVSGACFADLGNKVYCVDKDKSKINKLNNSISPIYEPGLDDLIRNNSKAKRLHFVNDLEKAVKESQIIFICVGTPNKKNSNLVDLAQVFNAAKSISKYIKSYKIIVNKSTVPVTSGDQIEKIIAKKVKKSLFDVISNPEFLREGEAIRDFKFPDRIVVGSDNKKVFISFSLNLIFNLLRWSVVFLIITKWLAVLFFTKFGWIAIRYKSVNNPRIEKTDRLKSKNFLKMEYDFFIFIN